MPGIDINKSRFSNCKVMPKIHKDYKKFLREKGYTFKVFNYTNDNTNDFIVIENKGLSICNGKETDQIIIRKYFVGEYPDGIFQILKQWHSKEKLLVEIKKYS